ncbi:MAG: SIR2 family protein [Actinomycetota bacterium]
MPERFLSAIGGDPGNCVLVVGAGLSKKGVRRRGAGIPDWDDLMQLMVRHLDDAGRCDKGKSEELRAMLKEDPPRYLDVAEEFSKAHSDDRDGYETFLRRHLNPNDLAESDLHKLILRIGFWGIALYNFDLVFEKHFDKQAPLVYPELMEQMGQFQRRGFFAKIHGCISRPASRLVLTKTSYDELRRHPHYGNLLTTVLLAHKVLCVGFSLRDPDFQSILTDLKGHWAENLPPLYALMRDPGEAPRSAWLKKGVDILPYNSHYEVKEFLLELAALAAIDPMQGRKRVSGGGKRTKLYSTKRESGQQDRQIAGSPDMDVATILTEWQEAQKIEEMDCVLSERLAEFNTDADKERLLFQLGALCSPNQAPHLCSQLIAVGTLACSELASKIITQAAKGDNLGALKPHRLHVPVHRWLTEQDKWKFGSGFHDETLSRLLIWLLDESWGAEGVNLWTTFLRILTRLRGTLTRHGLCDLYVAAEHIPGASAEIEKVVFADGFVREDDRERRWYKSWDEQIVQSVQFERFRKALAAAEKSPAGMLDEAFVLEASLPKNVYRPYTEHVLHRVLDDFVHRTHLTVHGSSDIYDPAKAREILEALAGLRIPQQQLTVLWAINHWPERMRGLISLGEDSKSLRAGLFTPLWWRYSSEARIEYLREHHRGFSPYPDRTGQDYLLEDIMGLRYDFDQDFRNVFNRSLDRYRDPKEHDRYEPRPLQELWPERELRYELVDDCPPELVRRVAIHRVDWENSRPGSVGWGEAKERAQQVFVQKDLLPQYVSAQRGDYAIDNLLGAYLPARRRIVLYTRMVQYAASELWSRRGRADDCRVRSRDGSRLLASWPGSEWSNVGRVLTASGGFARRATH